jgi:hypothetical protein
MVPSLKHAAALKILHVVASQELGTGRFCHNCCLGHAGWVKNTRVHRVHVQATVLALAVDIARAMSHLHSKNIAHGWVCLLLVSNTTSGPDVLCTGYG